MPERAFIDFLPLFPEETEEAILARWIAWANEGLTADDPRWVDTREGGMWRTCSIGSVRESAREYDSMTEVAAAAFPLWTWGSYLDDHAERDNLSRNEATQAVGEVTFTGPPATPIPAGTTVIADAPEVGADTVDFEVTTGWVIGGGGTVDVPVRALLAGSQGNVGVNAISRMGVPIPGVSVANAAATTGGTDTEADGSLRERLLTEFSGAGGANKLFYERIGRDYPGVGHVTVIALWDGPGTVKMIVTDPNGDPVSAPTLAGLQELVDPVPGLAEGDAPAGAEVTVVTATALNITVAATVELEPGVVLSTVEPTMVRVVADYAEAVQSGGEVVRAQVTARIARISGVHDVGNVLLNGAAANVAVPSDPARVPVVTSQVYTEGAL